MLSVNSMTETMMATITAPTITRPSLVGLVSLITKSLIPKPVEVNVNEMTLFGIHRRGRLLRPGGRSAARPAGR